MIKTVLFLNHKEKNCGVYQWGNRTGLAIEKSIKYKFIYKEVDSEEEFRENIKNINPDAILYNYHVATMSWLNPDILDEFRHIKQPVIVHEGWSNPYNEHSFDNYIYLIPDIEIDPSYNNVFKVGRLLLNYTGEYSKNDIVTFGTFGFGFHNY